MSDPLEELKRIAAKEADEAREKAESERRSQQKERESEAKKEADKIQDARRAPGAFGTMRFMGTAFVGVLIVTVLGSIWMEDDFEAIRPWMPLIPAWFVVIAFIAIDGLTWRSRLPFKLVGFETIGGTDKTGSDRVPYISFEVSITLEKHANHEAVAQTLEILVQRVNKAMFADKETDFGGNKVWRVYGGTRAGGQASKVVYTTRIIEKWLRKEARLLHSAAPISQIRVNAEYSGDSYWAPSSD